MDWAGLAVERVSSLDLDTYFKVSRMIVTCL